MRGPNQRSYWSTRQRLVVVTGDNEQSADSWPDRLDALMESARDVLDEWGDGDGVDLDALSNRMEQLRRTLWSLRQYEMEAR